MTEDAQLKIRLSQELKSILEERSKSNNRTMNGEIVNILEQALLNYKVKSGASICFNELIHVDYHTAMYSELRNYVAARTHRASSSTTRDNLIDYIKLPECVQITLFAIDNPKDSRIFLGALALVIINGIKFYILFDSSYLNIGSDHGAKEVQAVIDEALKTSKVNFINTSSPLTEELNPLEAVEKLKVLPLEPLTKRSIRSLLNLLH